MPGRQTLTEQAPTPPNARRTSGSLYAPPGNQWARAIARNQAPLSAAATGPGASHGSGGASTAAHKSDPDDRAIARAIVAGYQAAQHVLDTSGSVERTMEHVVRLGTVSLDYAGADFERVWAAADSFDHSLRARARKSPAKYKPLVETNDHIRTGIGLTGASKQHQNHAAGSDARYERALISPTLETLAIQVRGSIRYLEGTDSYNQDARMRVIDRITAELVSASVYTSSLLEQVPLDERSTFAGTADATALDVSVLLRWVRKRAAYGPLEARLLRGIGAFDKVLIATGGKPIGQRSEAVLTENQEHSGELEADALNTAIDAALDAIDRLKDALVRKIGSFKSLAELDDQPHTDFKTALMDAIIEAAVTSIVGQFAKTLSKAPASQVGAGAPTQPAAEFGLEQVFSIGSSSMKTTIAAKMKELPNSGGVDPNKRALVYFCDHMQAAEMARADEYRKNLRAMAARRTITAEYAYDVMHIVEDKKTALENHELELLTKSWATYLAQSRLGARGVGDDRISDMRSYFGRKTPGGREFGSSKAGGDGILSVMLEIVDGVPRLERSATKVKGLNSELQAHLFNEANHELNRVELPKEVHVHARFARATIALDERNQIRDVRDWDQVQRHVDGMDADTFWQRWGLNLRLG